MEDIIQLILTFIKIGAFSFGGGYAVLALIQKEVVDLHQWIPPEEFVNIVAIAEMTPGPIAVNSSTYVGYKLYGGLMGIILTLSVILIPFLLALLVSIYFQKFKDSQNLNLALAGIRPAVVGIIGAACFTVGKISIQTIPHLVFFLLAFLGVAKFKLNPILVLLLSGLGGVVYYGYLGPYLGWA